MDFDIQSLSEALPTPTSAMGLVVLCMGVSGSGKSTVAKALTSAMNCAFADADDYHSPENKEKMRKGIPLTDQDRIPWLDSLHAKIFQSLMDDSGRLVLACSALKRSYRKRLFDFSKETKLPASASAFVVFLRGSFELIKARIEHRQHEFMNSSLLRSQFDNLEEPTNEEFAHLPVVKDLIIVDVSREVPQLVDDILQHVPTCK